MIHLMLPYKNFFIGTSNSSSAFENDNGMVEVSCKVQDVNHILQTTQQKALNSYTSDLKISVIWAEQQPFKVHHLPKKWGDESNRWL